VAPSDAREKKRNIGTQLQSILYTTDQKTLWKIYFSVTLLVRTNLFIPSRFWTTDTNFDTCCQRYVATCRKNLYRCTSTVSALNYCSRIFFKTLSYLYEVVRTNFCADFFWISAIFDRNFANIVAPPSDENANYVVHLKEQSLPKKTLKTASKSGNKRQRKACSNYAPLECTVIRTWSVTNKQTSKRNKTRNKSIVPCWTMHTGRMSCHSTKKGVNYYICQ